MSTIVKILSLFLFSAHVCLGQQVYIPQKDIRLPSKDLVYNGTVKSPEELASLAKKGLIDLENLMPAESEVWNDQLGIELNKEQDQIDLDSGSVVTFVETLVSSKGQFRFNANFGQKSYTFVLEKTLHTMLLRKNLLRKLGYRIPKMDYRKQATVRFDNEEQYRKFTELMSQATLGASSRWVTKKDDQTLTMTLQDVVLMEPHENDHFNLVMGVPTRLNIQKDRVIRALAIPYALLNIRESINQVTWNVGRYDNQHYVLPIFVENEDLNTTIHDAKWMLYRLQSLTERDLKQVIDFAYYPKAISQLLFEKIKARRNSLLELFKIKHTKYAYNLNKNHLPDLKDGVLVRKEWDGYASNFVHTAASSPFEEKYEHFLTRAQTEIFGHLTGKLAEKLMVFDVGQARIDYFTDQFAKGLEHYLKTGEFVHFGAGAWYTPVLNGNLILNRSIILGSYQGSDNVVQMADTFGFSVEAGVHLGLEGVADDITSLYGRGSLQYLKTFTHLKPVQSLKKSLEEPYNKMFVPFVKKQLAKNTQQLANILSKDETTTEDQEQVNDIFSEIKKFLGVGESLIIDSKLIPGIKAGLSLDKIGALVSINGGYNYLKIKRTHIHRASKDQIHVYIDNGFTHEFFDSYGLSSQGFNLLRLTRKRSKGKYNVRFHNINVDTDVEKNPELGNSSLALSQLLENGSTELLDEYAPPFIVKGNFKDRTTRLKFLLFLTQKLKGLNQIQVQTPKGRESDFVTIKNEVQNGLNYEVFTIELFNHYLKKHLGDFSVTTVPFKNPGLTIFGRSYSTSATYEAQKVQKHQFKKEFIKVTSLEEGWKIKKKRLKKTLKNINKKYQTTLFHKDTLEDISNMKVYNIVVNLNIYEKGIENIRNMTDRRLLVLQNTYHRTRGCYDSAKESTKTIKCGHLQELREKRNKCVKQQDPIKARQCLLDFTTLLHEALDTKDLKQLIGAENYYLYGTITGFRAGSEILYQSEKSNAYGRIGSKHVHGPLQDLKRKMGIQQGEFEGSWMRMAL